MGLLEAAQRSLGAYTSGAGMAWHGEVAIVLYLKCDKLVCPYLLRFLFSDVFPQPPVAFIIPLSSLSALVDSRWLEVRIR